MAPAILGIGGHGFEYDSRQVLCTRSYLTQKGYNFRQIEWFMLIQDS